MPQVWDCLPFDTPAGQISMPALWGRSPDMVLSMIEWIHRSVRKIIPDEQWMRERYLRRTMLELLAEGTTFCWAPCPERTFVAASVLGLYGVPYRLVVHERQVPGAGPPSVHMAIELDLDGKPYWFDFSRWESKFFAGTYTFRTDIERTLGINRIEVPFSRELLNSKPGELMNIVGDTKWAEKVDWFVGDLPHIDPQVVEERIIFSADASRYEKAPPRPWAGDKPVSAA